ncbi:MAG: DUF1501 domain-containing protein [Pirellulales bacterium]|nr:DUF1501 domain-containing protein [Pirellulales bacterium]
MARRTACHNFQELERGAVPRRELLRAGSLGLLGLSLPGLLAGRARALANESAAKNTAASSFGRAKACILLFMWGGPAQQDTWDMKPDAPEDFRGEFSPIATNVPGISICEHFPCLAGHVDKLAIVRSMTHGDVNHTTATHFLLTGQPPPVSDDLALDWPHLGSVLAKLGHGRGVLPPFVSMRPKLENDVPRFVEQSHGQFSGWLGKAFDPLTIDHDPSRADYHVADFDRRPEITAARLDDRRALVSSIDEQRRLFATDDRVAAMSQHYARAFDILDSSAGGEAFDLTREPVKVRERYGMNPHGQSVLQARRLVERGVPLVTIFWPSDGIKNVSVYWDTHSRNFIDLKERLMPPADQAFSALLEDLGQRGMLDETLVVWTGEFGRTPRVGQRNSDAGAGADGRDHWPGCFSTVLAGGGIRGGITYGSSDRYAAYPASLPTRPVDLISTVYHCLGVPNDLVLHDSQGRPLVVCPGSPIRDLLA